MPDDTTTANIDPAHPGADRAAEPVGAPKPVAPEVRAPTPSPEPPVPLRPGLETPAATPAETNPFVRLVKWNADSQRVGSVSAMEVPGGCLVKSSFAWPGYMGESICFVPCVNIVDGKLAPTKCCGKEQA